MHSSWVWARVHYQHMSHLTPVPGSMNASEYQFLILPPWRGAWSALCRSLRTTVSKDESSFSALPCPRPVAAVLQCSTAVMLMYLGGQRGKPCERPPQMAEMSRVLGCMPCSLPALFACFPKNEDQVYPHLISAAYINQGGNSSCPNLVALYSLCHRH